MHKSPWKKQHHIRLRKIYKHVYIGCELEIESNRNRRTENQELNQTSTILKYDEFQNEWFRQS